MKDTWVMDWIYLDYLISIAVVAIGVSYVVTGSSAGYPLRWLWWKATHRTPLVGLFFCPACFGFWVGLVTALSTGSSLSVGLQAAFASCGLAAMVQSQFGLAAADMDIISGEESNEDGTATEGDD